MDSFDEPGVERAFLVGSTIVFDTASTSDIYAHPSPIGGPDAAPGGTGGLLFSHFFETQIRLHDVVEVGGRTQVVVEEVDEFNFGDELAAGEGIPPRRLMVYDLESGDRTLLIDVAERRLGLSTDVANGSVTKAAAEAGLVAVSFRTNTESWFELYTIDGDPFRSDLPYQEPTVDVPNVMAAISPDGSTVAVAAHNRVEVWDIDGTLLREQTVARDGLVTHIDFDGYRVAGSVGTTLGEADIGIFTLEVDGHTVISGATEARLTFAVPTPSDNAVPFSVRPSRGAPDPRSIFDQFQYEIAEFAGGHAYVGLIDGEQAITFSCIYDPVQLTPDDVSLLVGPIKPSDLPTLLAAAETIARQRACVPAPTAPFECLGLRSDPAACSE